MPSSLLDKTLTNFIRGVLFLRDTEKWEEKYLWTTRLGIVLLLVALL